MLLATALPAAVTDIRSRRIPNWLALAGLGAGVAGNFIFGGTQGLVSSGLGFGFALLVYFPLYLLRGMGAGDVKLMAALGAIAGPKVWFVILLFSSLIGSISGLMLAASKGRLRSTLINVGFMAKELASFRAPYVRRETLQLQHKESLRMPHGVAIAIGAILVFGVSLWGRIT